MTLKDGSSSRSSSVNSLQFVSERYGSNRSYDHYSISKGGRFELMVEHGKSVKHNLKESTCRLFQSVFLPQGYPESVSSDYLEYQIWDSLQAFCSSITGTLAAHALLKAYGVGDENATVLAATMTFLLKDGAGMIGRILFAWMKGVQLDCDAKRWRLVADVLNDIAIFLDLIAPASKGYLIAIVCLSSIGKSIVGVAGGATRAALTLHQARRDNMADVSAKDGSQETLVNLMALLAGLAITPLVSSNQLLVWVLFFVFTFLHLYANYRAVSAVVMETLNLPRFCILLSHYLKTGKAMLPLDVAKLDPVIRHPGYKSRIVLGAQFSKTFATLSDVQGMLHLKDQHPMFLLKLDCDSKRSLRTVSVVLHKNSTHEDLLLGTCQALLLDFFFQHPYPHTWQFESADLQVGMMMLQTKIQAFRSGLPSSTNAVELSVVSYNVARSFYPLFSKSLEDAGWDLSKSHLGADEWRLTWNNCEIKKIL